MSLLSARLLPKRAQNLLSASRSARVPILRNISSHSHLQSSPIHKAISTSASTSASTSESSILTICTANLRHRSSPISSLAPPPFVMRFRRSFSITTPKHDDNKNTTDKTAAKITARFFDGKDDESSVLRFMLLPDENNVNLAMLVIVGAVFPPLIPLLVAYYARWLGFKMTVSLSLAVLFFWYGSGLAIIAAALGLITVEIYEPGVPAHVAAATVNMNQPHTLKREANQQQQQQQQTLEATETVDDATTAQQEEDNNSKKKKKKRNEVMLVRKNGRIVMYDPETDLFEDEVKEMTSASTTRTTS